MKVTAQLALDQIKINRKRTAGTVLAVALSTAIVTALMCFATSANSMLVNFFGESYGEYDTLYSGMIGVPAALLCLLIGYMSVSCISNIFAASANKRIREFGIIKCVGGTRKQIKEIVLFESLWISAIGIPLGLLAGTLTGWVGVSATSHFIDRINEISKSIIMRPFDASFDFTVSGWTYLPAAAASLTITLLSAAKPAGVVGKIAPIQCIRGLGANLKLNPSEIRGSMVEKLFGYEGVLGVINTSRNKAGYKAVTRSLGLGLTLLIMFGGLAAQANDIQNWMDPHFRDIMVDFCSVINEEELPDGSIRETYPVPITAERYNEIKKRLDEYDAGNVYGIGADTLTYKCKIDSSLLTDPSKMSAALAGKDDLWNVTILSVDDELYEELCRRADAPSGSNLILNTFRRNDRGTMKSFVPFRSEPASLTLSDTEGVLSELPIGGMLYEEDLSENGFREPLSDSIRIVVPNARVRYFDWFCDTEDETGYSDYAKKVMNDYYPILTEDSYVEQGYTVRISRADTMAQALNLAIILAEYVMYGFVILLIVIGFTGVISTISTNTRIRSREFAVLKSIGMTDGALRKMVYSESVVCLVKAIVPGVFFGLLIPFVINLVLRQTMPSRFHFPLFSLIAGVVLVSAVVLLITRVEISKLKNKSIIQEIRMDVM